MRAQEGQHRQYSTILSQPLHLDRQNSCSSSAHFSQASSTLGRSRTGLFGAGNTRVIATFVAHGTVSTVGLISIQWPGIEVAPLRSTRSRQKVSTSEVGVRGMTNLHSSRTSRCTVLRDRVLENASQGRFHIQPRSFLSQFRCRKASASPSARYLLLQKPKNAQKSLQDA